jgi:hypothetical protein
MRLFAGLASLLLVALLSASPARAYTPESGIWYNPAESGSGYLIEIQDNLMVLAYYGGDAQGRPTWWTATGFLTGNALFDTRGLDLTVGSQCPGCAYPGFPTVQAGAGGTVRIVFDSTDNTRATLTWGNGRTVQIQRYAFYTKRPEDPAGVPAQVTRMLGEWQAVMDFSSNANSSFEYYGDVLVFDDYSFDNPTNRWYYDGCRADNSEDGGCSNNALAFHSASGYYDSANGLQVIVVDDSTANYLLYLVEVGTNSGQGEITVYPKGQNPNNYDAYPMRAFRTASRTFVQEGTGPAKADGASKARRSLGEQLVAGGVTLQAKSNAVSKYDRAALLETIRGLEQQLEAKRAAKQ